MQSIKRHLIFLEEKQDNHELLTAEIINLYKGASIIGKMTAWVVGIAGGIGALIMLVWGKR